MLKKMMVLALSAAAILAVAAPAAQADRLWHGGPALTGGTGQLTSVSATGLSTGPAPVTFSGSVTNGGTTGSITAFLINGGAGGIPTNVPNCTARGTVGNLPWQVHLQTPDTMTIANMTFTLHYTGAGCAPAGVPPSISTTGDLTLTIGGAQIADADPYNDAMAPTLTAYNPASGLHITPTIGMDLRGQATWKGATIT